MQMYWSDYFGDTRHLSCEQHGAYLQLLGSMWLAGGRLPNDPRKLAKITGCTASRWAKIAADVLAFFDVEGDEITHGRVGFELEKAQEKSIKRAEAGSLGGKAKSLKTHASTVAKANDLPKHSPEPEPESDIADAVDDARELVADDWPEGDAEQHQALLCAEIASPWLDPNKSLGLVTSRGRLAAWRRDGASWRYDVLPVITAICARRRKPIGSWGYFDAAVAESMADNRAALAIPLAEPHATGPPGSLPAPMSPSSEGPTHARRQPPADPRQNAREANHARALAGADLASRLHRRS